MRPSDAMHAAREFARFRAAVFADHELAARLAAEREPGPFADLAVRLGSERGFAFDLEAVGAAIAVGRRAWLERWLE
jgi:hypothetical protein